MTGRVLIVDDDESSAITLCALLECEGYEVELIHTYDAAVEHLGSERQYTVVVLDYNLGDRLGVDLVPLIRERVPEGKIVLLSGQEMAGTHGTDATIMKGGDFPVFLDTIQGLVAS